MAVYNVVNQLIGKSLVGAIAVSTIVNTTAIAQAQLVTRDIYLKQREFSERCKLLYGSGCPDSDTVGETSCTPSDSIFPIGSSQNTPILPNIKEKNRFIFFDFPSGNWGDPPTTYGFEFVMASNSLFTEILDFPVGIDKDNLFTVSVGNKILGQFGPSQSVDFVALLGQGVSEFTITGIDQLVDASNCTAFPIKLAFSTPTANFGMQALERPQNTSIPEPSSLLGLLTFGSFGAGVWLKRQRQQAK